MKNFIRPNKPSDLSKEDLLHHKAKGDAIKDILENHLEILEDNKMFALFGEWGSGKTGVLEYLKYTLNKKIFNIISFEAWQHENDDNLSKSLLDVIISSAHKSERRLAQSLYKVGQNVLISAVKAIEVSSPIVLNSAPILKFSGKSFTDSIDGELEREENGHSVYIKKKKFRDVFLKFEKQLLERRNVKKNVVFIDDLDRCEPEHVLELLRVIKLFFTYGKNTIYFCAIDKTALQNAIKIKYGNVINAEAYIEKIFDISFSMPKTYSLSGLLEKSFNIEISSEKGTFSQPGFIDEFLRMIKFVNPRHVKKVINKFEILKEYKSSPCYNDAFKLLIPDEILKDDQNAVVIKVFILFIIILYEFYPEQLNEIEDYDGKMKEYALRMMQENNNRNSGKIDFTLALDRVKNLMGQSADIKLVTFKSINDFIKSKEKREPDAFVHFLSLFTPMNGWYSTGSLTNESFIRQFENNQSDKLFLFSKYLLQHKQDILELKSEYEIWTLFEMAKTLL